MAEIQKGKAGRPRVDAVPITVRVPPDLIEAIDSFITSQEAPMSRPEAIRLLMRRALGG